METVFCSIFRYDTLVGTISNKFTKKRDRGSNKSENSAVPTKKSRKFMKPANDWQMLG